MASGHRHEPGWAPPARAFRADVRQDIGGEVTMSIDRRRFLTGAGLGAGALSPACRSGRAERAVAALAADGQPPDWSAVRSQFLLSREHIHLALMLMASHPRPVREAIERHRRGLDENPTEYVEQRLEGAEGEVRAAVAAYTGGSAGDIALTDSTTMALSILYGGLPLAAGQEVLTTVHDHYATHENLRLLAARSGVPVRKVALYDQPSAASEEEIAGRLQKAIAPQTRVVGVTWVHSSTGVKLPIRRLAAVVEAANRQRGEDARILFCVDGVHGFGVERESPAELGCDFFAAGCHKWIFGPRGTGVLWGRPAAWKGHHGLIPSFDLQAYLAWIKGELPGGPPGPLATPGGFHSFEHRWALGEAFALHRSIGRERITARIHQLARQCKEGLREMAHVKLHTPLPEALSSGLVCFEVDRLPAPEVVKRLHARRIIASVTPYATQYARFSPGILNTPEEIDTALREVRALA
jgi:isopenicillin-N epimerase